MTPILAADIQINSTDRAPLGFVLRPGESRIIEVNGRSTSLGTSSGSLELQQIDAYGVLVGGPSAVTPGAPMALGSSARWRALADGDTSSPLVFS